MYGILRLVPKCVYCASIVVLMLLSALALSLVGGAIAGAVVDLIAQVSGLHEPEYFLGTRVFPKWAQIIMLCTGATIFLAVMCHYVACMWRSYTC